MRIAKRIEALKPSATLAVTNKAKQLQAQGVDIVGFGAGEPDFDTPDFIKDAAAAAMKQGKVSKYTPASGMPDLRQAIVDKFKRDNALSYSPEQVVVSCGAKHSIYNIVLTLCQEGDEVLIPAPYWVSYPEMVKSAGATPVILPTTADNDFCVTPEQLEKAVTPNTRLFIFSSPGNPTGSIYRKRDLEQLAAVLVKHNVAVLSDEIYEKLVYDGERHVSIASLGREISDLTFTVNGVSKTYAMTGWRIGYAAGPVEPMKYIGRLQEHSTSNPSAIAQHASLAALRGDEKLLDQFRALFQKRRDLMLRLIGEIPAMSCRKPSGAFYVYPDVSSVYGKTIGGVVIRNSFDFAQAALEQAHVAVVPGGAFGTEQFIRLSYAASEEQIEKGLKRLKEFLS